MNVPKLRFKEFDGEFQYEKTARFFKHIRNGFVGTATPYYTDSSGIKYLQSNNIKDGQINEKNIVYINKEFHKKHEKNTLKMGDLLVVQSGHAGDCAVVNEKYINCNCHALIIMTPNSQDEISTDFLNVYMHTTKGKKELNKLITGNTIKHILASDMKKFNFPNLQIEEQKKIAGFFKILNKKIQLQQQKIDLLQEQKTGFLQKMFPKAGETQPEMRFDGFTENWKECKLGDVSNIIGGGTPSTSIEEYWNGNINWYSPVEIGEEIYVYESRKKITEAGLKKSSARILPIGTVLFTSRAGIGNTAILAREGCTNQGFQSIVPLKEKLDSYFIFSRTEELKRYAEINGAGSTFVEISGKQMSKMPILLPDLKEQKKIGLFFKRLDDEIILQKTKLNFIQQQKQGFMQQMFI